MVSNDLSTANLVHADFRQNAGAKDLVYPHLMMMILLHRDYPFQGSMCYIKLRGGFGQLIPKRAFYSKGVELCGHW